MVDWGDGDCGGNRCRWRSTARNCVGRERTAARGGRRRLCGAGAGWVRPVTARRRPGRWSGGRQRPADGRARRSARRRERGRTAVERGSSIGALRDILSSDLQSMRSRVEGSDAVQEYRHDRSDIRPSCFHFPSPSDSQKMADLDQQNGSPETKEQSPKIRKLHHNGAADVGQQFPLLKVKKLSESAILPSRASPFSAGYDLSSAIEIKVPARGKALVATGLSIGIPEGTYARVAPRSGLALKHSIDVGAGVIDADYRGEVGVILFNHSDVDFEVKVGDRIAQLIIEKIMTPDVVEVEELDSTARGVGGFGSTGVSVL